MKKVIYYTLFVLQAFAMLDADSTQPPAQAIDLPNGQKLADLYWNSPIGAPPTPGNPSPGLTLSWDKPADPDNRSLLALTVIYTGTSTLQKRLLSLPYYPGDDGVSSIMTQHYALTGEVSYENAASGSYLEMWSYFNPRAPGYPEGAYFSRTLGSGGPMGKIEGTSDWHDFWLPFDATGMPSPPIRLEVNLHLTGPGTIHLRNMKLMQYPANSFVAGQVPSAAARTLVQITMSPDGSRPTYSVDGKAYDDAMALKMELAVRHHADPNLAVVLRADKTVPYNALLAAMDAARDAGVQVAMSSDTPVKVSPPPVPVTLAQVGAAVSDDQTQALKIIWFCLGVVSTTALLLAGTAILFVSRLWQRRQHERELRRIASLDS